MTDNRRPVVVVSDVHLGHRSCDAVAADLARLVDLYPGAEIVLNGDTFNLSCDPWDRDPAVSASAMLAAHPSLRAALERHLLAGNRLTIIAGNHDARIHHPSCRLALLDLLTGGAFAELSIEPWFIRRGSVHIEHGHLYDPANSPTHPLAAPTRRTEPVGVELTRRFIGPYGAWTLFGDQWAATTNSHVHLMFDHFGRRAPVAMLHYCALLVAVNAGAARHSRLDGDRKGGDAALASYATRTEVAEPVLRALIAARRKPYHFSGWDTFLRFRFDGALAALAIPAGILAGLIARRLEPLLLSAAGFAYLAVARSHLAARGANHMPASLRAGAALVRQQTAASLVIFGHTHIEDVAEGYLNLGAFGDTPRVARTYVYVDENGHAERRAL